MNNKEGFTLTELLIVIAVLAILVMIAAPAYLGYQKRAVRAEAFSNLQGLRLLEEQYLAENGTYAPTTGTAGANQFANVSIINTGPPPILPGFLPGVGTTLKYSYQIIQNQQITATNPLAYAALTPCFTAIATANTGNPVTGDIFAIDCKNTRNF